MLTFPPRRLFRFPACTPLALTAAIMLALFPASLWATDWYVDLSNPNCPGSGTQTDPFCKIQDAINDASNNDTINIAPGRYVENLTIDKDLALIGTGGQVVTIVDGDGQTTQQRVVTVPSARTVDLKGLTLTNGSAQSSGPGGGIFANGGTLIVADFTVSEISSYLGGWIAAYSCTLTLTNSTVCVNGSFYARGGGIYSNGGTATLTNCTVSGNASLVGGGIYWPSPRLRLTRWLRLAEPECVFSSRFLSSFPVAPGDLFQHLKADFPARTGGSIQANQEWLFPGGP